VNSSTQPQEIAKIAATPIIGEPYLKKQLVGDRAQSRAGCKAEWFDVEGEGPYREESLATPKHRRWRNDFGGKTSAPLYKQASQPKCLLRGYRERGDDQQPITWESILACGYASLMGHTPVTLEAVKVNSYAELFALPPAEVLQRLDAGSGVPLHEGDAFLAVLVLRSVADLSDASTRLERATKRLLALTAVLVLVTVIAVVVSLAS
jgi:hypothetical protein